MNDKRADAGNVGVSIRWRLPAQQLVGESFYYTVFETWSSEVLTFMYVTISGGSRLVFRPLS